MYLSRNESEQEAANFATFVLGYWHHRNGKTWQSIYDAIQARGGMGNFI